MTGCLLPENPFRFSALLHLIVEGVPEPWKFPPTEPRIRQLRARRGISQEVLADFVGKTSRWLRDVENGKATPSVADIGRMALALRYPEPVIAGWAPIESHPDVNRRDFLKFGTIAAAVPHAIIDDALRASQPTQPRDLAPTWTEFTGKLRQLESQLGGGYARTVAADYLNGRVLPKLRELGEPTESAPKLWMAASQLAHLVAWMEFDVGHHDVADQYLGTALTLATYAHDDAFITEILAATSHHALHLRNCFRAIEAARAAQGAAQRTGIRSLTAEAYLAEAQGHALRRDAPAAAQALHKAEAHFNSSSGTAQPDWLRYFDRPYVAARFAHALRDLHDWSQCTEFAEQAIRMTPDLSRARAFNTIILAEAKANNGHIHQACQLAIDASDLVGELDSQRATLYLVHLQRDLNGIAPNTRPVHELNDRLSAMPKLGGFHKWD